MSLKFKSRPKIQCWATSVADFHYGPVEYYECFEPATHVSKGEDKIFFCGYHAKLVGERVYRFRKV